MYVYDVITIPSCFRWAAGGGRGGLSTLKDLKKWLTPYGGLQPFRFPHILRGDVIERVRERERDTDRERDRDREREGDRSGTFTPSSPTTTSTGHRAPSGWAHRDTPPFSRFVCVCERERERDRDRGRERGRQSWDVYLQLTDDNIHWSRTFHACHIYMYMYMYMYIYLSIYIYM